MYFLSLQDFKPTSVGHVNKGFFYNEAFQYLRSKKIFLDENPKTLSFDMKKLETPQKYENVL